MTTAPAGQDQPRLAPGIDPERLAPALAGVGRLHIPNIFDEASAARIAGAFAAGPPWIRSIRAVGAGGDMAVADWDGMTQTQVSAWRTLLQRGADQGLQFQFDSWRISDTIEAGQRQGGALAPLEAVYDWMNGAEGLDFLRRLTGDPACAYVDAQATHYRPGDFLGRHHDDAPGKNRLYAYVLNFSPVWRPDWGGALLFLDGEATVLDGFNPTFNALNIFRVPQDHYVSMVVPHAPAPRLSITGWIRSRRD